MNAELFAEAKKVIPGGVNSPVRAFGSVDATPLFISNAKGAEAADEGHGMFGGHVAGTHFPG